MNQSELKMVPKHAMKNRNAIESSDSCACYRCCKTFEKSKIIEWTDQNKTAICPECGCDTIIARISNLPFDESSLRAMKKYWFEK